MPKTRKWSQLATLEPVPKSIGTSYVRLVIEGFSNENNSFVGTPSACANRLTFRIEGLRNPRSTPLR